jgi:copper(I)-binding protein
VARRVALAAFALAGLVLGHSALAQVTVSKPWVRATVPQQQASGAFMTLTAKSNARLVDVRTPVAASAEIHAMRMSGDMMSMSPVHGLDLPAGMPVRLAPGGEYHVMLLGLKHPLKSGDTVPLTLLIEQAGKPGERIEVQAPVLPLTSSGPDDH